MSVAQSGSTALHQAVAEGHHSIIRMLLAAEADTNSKNMIVSVAPTPSPSPSTVGPLTLGRQAGVMQQQLNKRHVRGVWSRVGSTSLCSRKHDYFMCRVAPPLDTVWTSLVTRLLLTQSGHRLSLPRFELRTVRAFSFFLMIQRLCVPHRGSDCVTRCFQTLTGLPPLGALTTLVDNSASLSSLWIRFFRPIISKFLVSFFFFCCSSDGLRFTMPRTPPASSTRRL